MKYKGRDYQMWDAWFLAADDAVHAFHLKDRGSAGAPVGHAVSRDLLHWEPLPDILYPQDEVLHPDDCLQKYTGCAATDPQTGEHYVYYTMRDKVTSEKIGVARTRDLRQFTLYEGNPVLTPDPALFSVKPQGQKTDCRDMLVVAHEGVWYAYFAAMASLPGRGEVGVIGVAKGDDLLHFGEQAIAYVPSFNGVVEVPDVFYEDGRWYLTMLTGANYGARGIADEPDVSVFTAVASADSPMGPFTEVPGDLLIAGPANSGYTCRHVDFHGKRYFMYIDRSADGFALSLPKEERVNAGQAQLWYAPILQALRSGQTVTAPPAAAFRSRASSFAWQTGFLPAQDVPGGVALCPGPHDYARCLMEGARFRSLEAEFTLTLSGDEGGFYYEIYDGADRPQDNCFIAADVPHGTLTLYTRGLELIPAARRAVAFERGGRYHLRVLLMEGQLEVYVDDLLVMQVGTPTAAAICPGFFAGRGGSTFTDIAFYELEK